MCTHFTVSVGNIYIPYNKVRGYNLYIYIEMAVFHPDVII